MIISLFLLAGTIETITMTSWDNYFCGGYGISVKVVNPDGTQCMTDKVEGMSAGDTLNWSWFSGGLKSSCSGTVVTSDSTLYIQSDSGDDFCPKWAWVTTDKGAKYGITKRINTWYDYQTNNKAHRLSLWTRIRTSDDIRLSPGKQNTHAPTYIHPLLLPYFWYASMKWSAKN